MTKWMNDPKLSILMTYKVNNKYFLERAQNQNCFFPKPWFLRKANVFQKLQISFPLGGKHTGH